jgi:hypothetical protein
LYATVLVLSQGNLTAVIVDLDFLEIPTPDCTALRERVACALKVDAAHVRISCTHTHAGPPWSTDLDGGSPDLPGMELVPPYTEHVADMIVQAAEHAWAARRPVQLDTIQGSSVIAVQRRLRHANGRMLVGACDEGFVDRTLTVARLHDEEGASIASVVGFAAHPTTLGPANQLISPDYPGVARRIIEQLIDAPCLFLQGSAGDQMTSEAFGASLRECERMGTMLGVDAARLLLELDLNATERTELEIVESGAPLGIWHTTRKQAKRESRLAVVSRAVLLPVRRHRPVEELRAAAQAAQQAATSSGGNAEANYQAKRAAMELQRAIATAGKEVLPVEVQIIACDGLALVATPLEPFAEIGLAITKASPFPVTQFAGYSNGWEGYLPLPEDFDEGGYEAEWGTPFAPEAAAVLTQAVGEMLDALHREMHSREKS